MIDRKEIELLIRAQLRGERDIASVTKSITDLEAAIKRQAEEASKGVGSIDDLKASMLALKNAQDSLTAQADTIGRFQKLAEAIQRTEERVQRAGKAYDTYKAKLDGLSVVTDAQQERLQKLSQSFDRAQTTISRQRTTFEQLGESLRAAGVDTNKLADAETRLRETAGQVGVLYAQSQAAIQNYAVNAAKAREETAALAKQQREAARDAELFAAAEQRAAKAAEQRARAAQDVQLAQISRRGEAAAASRADDEARAALERQRELAALRRDIEERSAQTATAARRDEGLRKTAEDAEAAARGYSTLARASTNLRPKIVSLRDAVNAINDPAKAARSSLAGVEQQIAEIASSVGKAEGPIQDVADQLRNLQNAQRAISDQAGLIDNYQRQLAVLRQQRAEFAAARAQVAQYAAAVRQGGEAGEAFVRPLAEAQARLRAAAAAIRDQVSATRQSRDALRDAGINTGNLADAQRRLTDSAKTAAQASKQLADASERQATATKGAAQGFQLFRDEGRTTLSLVQRIRGEILALTAAYVGLQGVISLLQGSLQASVQNEGLRNTLAFALGSDGQQVTQQIEYLRKEADRLGIAFGEASKSYARFAASAIKSGAPVQEAQFIFESFSEVARVINLTPDQLNGLFNALGQSFSKGKIQAEELRQQIGERLPGAFAFAQEALADVFPNLDKALEQGQVGAENILVIAESIRRAAAGQLPAAIKSLDAEQQRFNNSLLFFKQQIGDGEFGKAYINLLKDLTELLRSEDGAKFAQAISSVFASLVSILRLLINNLEEVKLVAGLVAGVFAAGLFGTVVAKAAAAKAAIIGVAVALTAAQKAALVFGAFIISWNIGAYFRDKFLEVELAGVALVTGFASIWSRIKFGAMELWEDLPRLAGNAFKSLINEATTFMRLLLTVFQAGARALGLTGLAEGIGKALDTLTLKTNQNVSSRVAQIRAEAEADLKRIQEIGNSMVDDIVARRANTSSQQARPAAAAQTTASPGRRRGSGGNEPSEADIRKRESAIESITRALESLSAKIDRTQTDTLAKQLDAIDTEYQALARRIKELGGKEAVNFTQQLETAVAQLKLQTTRKFNDKLLAEQESLLRKIEQAEAAAGRRDKTSLDAQLQAIQDSYAATYREIEEARLRFEANNRDTSVVDEQRRRLDAAVKELTVLKSQKFNRDEIQRREQQINDIVQTRAARLQTIENQVQAGIITREQADQRQRETIAQLQPQIETLVADGQEFALSISGAFDPIKLQEFLDKLQLVTGSGARLNAELIRTGKVANESITKLVDSGLNAAYDSLVEVTKGTKSWGDAFKTVGAAILQTLAQILREIAIAMARKMILTALGVPVAHSGMVVGQGSNRTRAVSPGWFMGAPRYHAGGIVGLRPDEYPAILQKNEEVLSRSDPRNVLNGGLSGGNASQAKAQRFVLVDDRSRVAEAMAGSEGEEVTMVHLRKNIPTLRQLIKGG